MTQLEVRNVTKQFGGLVALNDVSFSVAAGEIRGLIGPNGAGKSTMFKTIAGFHAPTQGSILYEGADIAGSKPHVTATKGIVRTFQETTLFQEMTVYENVLTGCHLQARSNVFAALFGLDRVERRRVEERSNEVLAFMGLQDRRDQFARELPLGSQRALAVAIALAAQPRLLLLDEPFAGMNPEETQHMMVLTRKVRDSGVTVILVEHDMKAVMGLCENITVLNFGSVLAQGTPAQIRSDSKVIEAYLGGT
ncbi:MAG: ABC transporter ATP-binding protein [Chromatiales bacterium]